MSKKPTSYFRVYKNASSPTWRVDLAVPVAGTTNRNAYVGTLIQRLGSNGLPLYEGAVTAIDSTVLRQNITLAESLPADADVAFLRLTELPQPTSRHRRRKLAAKLHLASGRYHIDAHYGANEIQIVGNITVLKDPPQPDAGQARRNAGARVRAQRPKTNLDKA